MIGRDQNGGEAESLLKEKYSKLLIEQMKHTFAEWNAKGRISEAELYAFLHRIKGTAGSIGLGTLSDLASCLMEKMQEGSEHIWEREAWSSRLKPLLDWMSDQGADSKAELALEKSTEPAVQPDSQQILILIIDKDAEFVSYVKEHLENRGYAAFVALTLEKGMELFYRSRPAFVLLDMDLRDAGQNEFQRFIVTMRKTVTPIVLTGKDYEHKKRVFAYTIGASDYMEKPLNLDLLFACLFNKILWRQDILRLTTIDELTGAFNRKQMNAVLTHLLQSGRTECKALSIAILDLDHFKQVNDQYGHLTGDEVLKRMVAVAQSVLQSPEEIFRFGGEEFVVIMPDADELAACERLEDIRQRFAAETFQSGNTTFHATFSAGIAAHEAGDSQAALLEKADQALYRSKEKGRNQTTVYDKNDQTPDRRVLHLIIIDDDPFVRMILKQGFAEWTCRDHMDVNVHVYPDGMSFLESGWYKEQDQYVILLDGILPDMDGIEVLSEIRSGYPDKNIIVSMLSARSDETAIVHALERGADDYLLKPFNLSEVIARVGRLAQRMLSR